MSWERDEWRHAVAELTEAERQDNCGHSHRTTQTCPDCGDTIDKDEA